MNAKIMIPIKINKLAGKRCLPSCPQMKYVREAYIVGTWTKRMEASCKLFGKLEFQGDEKNPKRDKKCLRCKLCWLR